MPLLRFELNGEPVQLDVDEDMPLLWVLRDVLGLTGTKYGCGIQQCGACTVHLDDEAVRTCQLAAAAVHGRRVTTIEGVGRAWPNRLHPVQAAWIAAEVPQCGYCQSGQIMGAAGLLKRTATPTDAQIDEAMAGHLCRCGTYVRIRRAIHDAARVLAAGAQPEADQERDR